MTAVNDGIGNYLQELRTAKRITAVDLAQRTGLRRATLSDWQTGKRVPRLPELETVLTVLNASEAQRQRALKLVKAPRAVQKLRSQAGKSTEELVELAGHLPHGGDLLRALRMRKGWTQAQVASAIDVQQASITRWERSEIWPSPERLQALCYALDAHEEEIVALMIGRFSLADGKPAANEEEIHRNMMKTISAPNPPTKTALNELTLLSLAAQAWPLALERPSGRYLLAEIYKTYSDRLFLQRRFPECIRASVRSLELYTSSGRILTHCVRSAIRAAAAMAQVGGRQEINRAIELLQLWLPHAQNEIYASWILSDLSKLHVRIGNKAEALALVQKSYGLLAGIPNQTDRMFRQQDFAEVLARTGAPHRALDYAAHGEKHPYVLVSQAHLYRELKDLPTAHQMLAQVNETAEDPFMGTMERPYYSGEVTKIADTMIH